MTNDDLARHIGYLEAKVSVLTIMLSLLLAAFVKEKTFEDWMRKVDKAPLGYTAGRAAIYDGRRDAIRDLRRTMGKFRGHVRAQATMD